MSHLRAKIAAAHGTLERAPLSLLSYPLLMASDILLHKATHVPVGLDQAQHVEFARNIVELLQRKHPAVQLQQPQGCYDLTVKVGSLRDATAKMSKSESGKPDSCLLLIDSPGEMQRKLAAAQTDSEHCVRYDLDGKPGISNLLQIYASFSGLSIPAVEAHFAEGSGTSYRQLKEALAALLSTKLAPIRNRYLALKASNDAAASLVRQLERNEEALQAGAQQTFDCFTKSCCLSVAAVAIK